MNKEAIVHQLFKLLEEKKQRLQQQKQSLQEDLQSETKSSMGDKYETTRAQLHLELEKLELQELQLHKEFQHFQNIPFKEKFNTAEIGALVITSSATFLMGMGIGNFESEKEKIFCISLESPIGQELKGKKVGESISFNGKNYTLEKIV